MSEGIDMNPIICFRIVGQTCIAK